jgi:hypothetical protein
MNALVESLVSQDFVWEAEVNKRESVAGYIKDPQKLAAVWRKEAKTGWTGFQTGWTGFHQEDPSSLTYSAGDSIGFKTGWARKKFGWTGFPKKICNDFSDSSDYQTGQSRDGRGTVPKPVEPVSGPVKPVSRAEKQLLNILKRTKVELLWEVKMVFLKGIHDLEKCSQRWFWRILNLAHCIT